MLNSVDAATAEQGQQYGEQLIAVVETEHREGAHPLELESDLLRSVVHELTEPYHCADSAASHSSTCSVVIGGVTVVLRECALQSFANVLWNFVALRSDRLDEATLSAFRGD